LGDLEANGADLVGLGVGVGATDDEFMEGRFGAFADGIVKFEGLVG